MSETPHGTGVCAQWGAKSTGKCAILQGMLRSTAALMFMCGAALVSLHAQEASSGRSQAGEFQKLEPALKFLRARNARDYAVTTPNGIDEASYVTLGGL